MATANMVKIGDEYFSPKHPLAKALYDVKRNREMQDEKAQELYAEMGLKPAKRLRQSSKPLLNPLEQEYFNILNAQYPNYPRPRGQAKKYRIGNNAFFKPDITASIWPQDSGPAVETAWEIKGRKGMKNQARGYLALKAAASAWPEVKFILCWKENGQWLQQIVLP